MFQCERWVKKNVMEGIKKVVTTKKQGGDQGKTQQLSHCSQNYHVHCRHNSRDAREEGVDGWQNGIDPLSPFHNLPFPSPPFD